MKAKSQVNEKFIEMENYMYKILKIMYKILKISAKRLTLCAACAKCILIFSSFDGVGVNLTLTEPMTSRMLQGSCLLQA